MESSAHEADYSVNLRVLLRIPLLSSLLCGAAKCIGSPVSEMNDAIPLDR